MSTISSPSKKLSTWRQSPRESDQNRIRALFEETEGSEVLELAFALPLFLLIMTGIFSFSIVLYQRLALAEAVSSGGRVLAVDRGDSDPCKTATAAIYAAAPALSTSSMSFTYVLNGTTTTGTTCPGSSGLANPNLVSGGSAEITVSYPATLSLYAMKSSSITLQSQITEEVQ